MPGTSFLLILFSHYKKSSCFFKPELAWEMGSDYLQVYYFAKPMKADHLLAFLRCESG